jgi:isopenicillin-N N-acyltransferase-like protein
MSLQAVPVIDVKGAPRERGRQQGEGARSMIAGMRDAYRELLPAAFDGDWEEALLESQELLPRSEVAFPAFVDELRGIAEGSGVSFDDVWLLNCYEEVAAGDGIMSCTSLAVQGDLTAEGHVLLAHNEDWISVDRDHVYLVRSEPDNGPPFLGMTYGALLPNVGLNGEGVGVAINTVYSTDVQAGVPRVIFSRAVLSSRSIGDGIAACLFRGRAGGYNYLLADANGELYNVETSALLHSLLYADEGWVVHTNHYLSPKMQALEQLGTFAGSHVRLNRARRLLRAQLVDVTVESLQALLRDHVNRPSSICSHEDDSLAEHEREQTVISLVMDLTERKVWAAPGSPCEGEYVEHKL